MKIVGCGLEKECGTRNAVCEILHAADADPVSRVLHSPFRILGVAALFLAAGVAGAEERANGGSLFKQAQSRRATEAMVAEPEQRAPVSFTAVGPTTPRKFKKHDVVQIIVREESQTTTNATAQSNKKQTFDFQLQQFLELGRFAGTMGLGNVANPGKLPEIKFNYDNQGSADASHDRKDSMTMRLAAKVIDVKPNGTMVLEAVRHLRTDKEEQIMRLSGTCRVEDVTVDNTILSTQLADLNLSKDTKGDVRNGTKRGWLNNFLDKFNPF